MKVRIAAKAFIKGDVEVNYNEEALDTWLDPPGPATHPIISHRYTVDLSPAVSSWVDEGRVGK